MSKNLVIVESPAKAKTINKYLGKDYIVLASIGHIKDLPTKDLGVDVDNDFEPTYEVIPDKRKRNNKKTVSELKKAAKKAEAIWLAADPDREGEAICQHLQEELTKRNKKPVHRVMFNEITKKAILEAFKEPKEVNTNLVDSQQARRVLDRLVGYKVSPILWKTIGGRLSAGRVQTVAVRLVVEREREIEAFVKTEYWSVLANLAASLPPNFEAKLRKVENQTVKLGKFDQDVKKTEIHIKNKKQATSIVDEAKKQNFIVDEVKKKERKRNPTPPFITSKLQQDASRRFGFTVKKTMTVAQKLYEGKELGGDGPTGLITYMRTDSTRVSPDALENARGFIGSEYGDKYLPAKARAFKSKKDAQDAHEAIRPTDVNHTPEAMKKYLNADELKLYTLIWQRFVASQMTPAIFDQTTIDIIAGRFGFRATGSIQRFDGFLKVYQETKSSTAKEDDKDLTLPAVEKGDKLDLKKITPNQHSTEPPPRFSEATLVKALEENGVGRPSTYAAIMTTIQTRDYVEKVDKRFHPTALGTTVNDLLVENFSELFNPEYTAKMETSLDEIEDGKLNWRVAMKDFYDRFSTNLEKAKENIKGKKKQAIPTDEVCEKCDAGMVIKFGRYGQFLACENYPECKNTREVAKKADANAEKNEDGTEKVVEVPECELCGEDMVLKKGRFGSFYGCKGYPECKNIRKIPKGEQKPQAAPVELDEECPKDGAKLVKREGRFGEFISCSNYPKCKYIKQEKIGMKCTKDDCKGEIVVKKSRRGKVFYGCNEYPTCDVVFWNKPIFEKCPDCDAKFVLEKFTKRDGTTRYCNNEECDYKISVETPDAPDVKETKASSSAK